MIAIAPRHEVGVDVEFLVDLTDGLELAKEHFSKCEMLAWSNLPLHRRNQAFLEIWTRKEACVKAVGWGLNMPLASVNVGLGPLPRQLRVNLPNGAAAEIVVQSLAVGPWGVGAIAWVIK